MSSEHISGGPVPGGLNAGRRHNRNFLWRMQEGRPAAGPAWKNLEQPDRGGGYGVGLKLGSPGIV